MKTKKMYVPKDRVEEIKEDKMQTEEIAKKVASFTVTGQEFKKLKYINEKLTYYLDYDLVSYQRKLRGNDTKDEYIEIEETDEFIQFFLDEKRPYILLPEKG